MEPRQEEQKDKVTRTEEKEAKPRRFRIVKLEERDAPTMSPSSNPCASTQGHSSHPW